MTCRLVRTIVSRDGEIEGGQMISNYMFIVYEEVEMESKGGGRVCGVHELDVVAMVRTR